MSYYYFFCLKLQSFADWNGWILTQLPLPDTVVDVWRLVQGAGITTIVSLGPEADSPEVSSYSECGKVLVQSVRNNCNRFFLITFGIFNSFKQCLFLLSKLSNGLHSCARAFRCVCLCEGIIICMYQCLCNFVLVYLYIYMFYFVFGRLKLIHSYTSLHTFIPFTLA